MKRFSKSILLTILVIAMAIALVGCKTATLYDNYGALVSVENGQFKDMSAYEEYVLTYATPQSITETNSPLCRLGIPTKEISSISVKREAKSSSQGGTIFSAIGEACIGAVKLAAGVF